MRIPLPIQILIQTTRPAFLLLTPVCVFLGFSTALKTAPVHLLSLLWVLIGALAAHISVNTLNEYYDFKSGLDLNTEKTPFSGGSGALPRHPHMAYPVLILGLVALILMVNIGVYFTYESGIGVLLLGIAGLVLIIAYTQWVNKKPVLCLLAPGFGFGILMVNGTHLALGGQMSLLSIFVSLVPFLLVNNLLLLNQYPDMEADKSVGRMTFPIAYGIEKSNVVYGAFLYSSYLLITLAIIGGLLPVLSIIALIPMPLGIFTFIGIRKHFEKISEYPQYMAANVATPLLTIFLLAISIYVGGSA